MSYQMVLGVTVRCDDCFAAAARGDQPIGVWPTAAVSLDELPGWQSEGPRHHCPTCSRRRRCAAEGHRFGPWFPGPDEGRVPLVHHVCRVCGVDRVAPAYCVRTEPAETATLLAS
jgi:hypothetical protein